MDIYIYISSAIILLLLGLVIYYRYRLNYFFKRFERFRKLLSSSIGGLKDSIGKDRDRIAGNVKISNGDLASIQEITSSVLNQIKKNSGFIDSIINNIEQGILIINSDRKILLINELLAGLFYLDVEKVMGESTMMVFNNRKLEDLIIRVFDKGGPVKKNIIFYREEDLYLDIEAIPIGSWDSPDKSYTSGENVSTRSEGNRSKGSDILVIVNNATQEVEFSKLRSQFVANVSHQMRTPLTSIRGYIETSLEAGLEDKKRTVDYLNKSLKEVDRLDFLIKDIMNLSKIEYRRNVIFKDRVDLVGVISECIKRLSFIAEKNNVHIEFKYGKDPIYYQTDEELFTQLVRNMIENAIFYAGSGSSLAIRLIEDDENVLLDFEDNGSGIAKEDLPYVFQRFYRGKKPVSAKRIGSGLGLSIVKHTIELHGGRISVSSKPGEGTRFSIILPGKGRE